MAVNVRSSNGRLAFSGPSFDAYKLTGVRVTDRELGHGSYATVLELEYMKMRCAGKKIHEMLLGRNEEMEEFDDNYVILRFEEECRLLSKIRHSNIVQFLGVFFEEGAKVPTGILVMEFLHTNLTHCIEKYGVFPKEISYSILHDVALGLYYLHSQTPPIIHRDLSSNNVLLTANMTAKISDLGVARILNLTAAQVSQMTRVPGTIAFMPPEVMIANPTYHTSVDEFSYGILMIHILSGMWPEPLVGPTRTVDGELIPVTEAERRDLFLGAVGNDHPLYDLIINCISNDPASRPHADLILAQLGEMVKQFPTTFAGRLELLREIEIHKREKACLIREGERKDEEIRQKESQISNLKRELDEADAQQSVQSELQVMIHSTENERLQIQVRHEETARKLVESEKEAAVKRIVELEADLETKTRAVMEKDTEYFKVNSRLKEALAYLQTPKERTLQGCIRWEKLHPSPIAMCHAQSVVINGKVYFGGGQTKNEEDSYLVQCYDPTQDKWKVLPKLPVRYFGLGEIKGKLVVVGGETKSIKNGEVVCERSSQVWTFEGKSWKRNISSMSIARLRPAVISHKMALIVAGGEHYNEVTRTVEVFRTDQSKWQGTQSLSLPTACYGASAVLSRVENSCYVVGGMGEGESGYLSSAVCASIEDIFRDTPQVTTVSPLASERLTVEDLRRRASCLRMLQSSLSPWKALPDTLTYSPAIAVLAGSVITVGGWSTSGVGAEAQSSIHRYISSTDCWVTVGNLPVPLAETTCVSLSPAEVLVIGGWDANNRCNSETVYKLSLHLK